MKPVVTTRGYHTITWLTNSLPPPFLSNKPEKAEMLQHPTLRKNTLALKEKERKANKCHLI